MTEPVILGREDGRACARHADRPQAMNALSRALRVAIAETFDAWRPTPTCASAILDGRSKAFCAGLDLKELGRRRHGARQCLDARSGSSMRASQGP